MCLGLLVRDFKYVLLLTDSGWLGLLVSYYISFLERNPTLALSFICP